MPTYEFIYDQDTTIMVPIPSYTLVTSPADCWSPQTDQVVDQGTLTSCAFSSVNPTTNNIEISGLTLADVHQTYPKDYFVTFEDGHVTTRSSFNLKVAHVCDYATIQDPALVAMTTTVRHGVDVVQTATIWTDTEITKGVDNLYCGPRTITIVSADPVPQFLTVSSNLVDGQFQFTIRTDDASHVGPYNVVLEVSLQDYPLATPVQINLPVTIDPCVLISVDTLTPIDTGPHTYVINLDTQLTLALPLYAVNPSVCYQVVSYSVVKDDGSDISALATIDQTNKLLIVSTVDMSYEWQTITFAVTGTLNDLSGTSTPVERVSVYFAASCFSTQINP